MVKLTHLGKIRHYFYSPNKAGSVCAIFCGTSIQKPTNPGLISMNTMVHNYYSKTSTFILLLQCWVVYNNMPKFLSKLHHLNERHTMYAWFSSVSNLERSTPYCPSLSDLATTEKTYMISIPLNTAPFNHHPYSIAPKPQWYTNVSWMQVKNKLMYLVPLLLLHRLFASVEMSFWGSQAKKERKEDG